MTDHKIYQNIDEWYHPDIDYNEMMENFRWTHTRMTDLMREKKEIVEKSSFLNYEFPLKNIMLHEHSGMFEWDGKKEKHGRHQKFQFFNKQFNDELAKSIQRWNPQKVLEVGAGNGWLSRMLEMRGLNTIATDNFSWKLKQMYQVEKLGVKQALEYYKPDVVIGCWMPLGTDWTTYFRATPSVKHYIIIGEVEACCGGDWKIRKGWHRENLMNVEQWSVCRTDDTWDFFPNHEIGKLSRRHSEVWAFSRLMPKPVKI